MTFKCRCLIYLNQKCTGLDLMDCRMNLIHSIYPKGLHREWYSVDDLDLWFESDLEEGCTLIKHRTADSKYHFKPRRRLDG
ncbi:hypothetical protein [Methanobrevibacter sp.]|uniref:hypothetical protein n=1 Tax=Methanobrevibacter sp. TaxID=66852 RepID=UPI00386AB6E9